GRRAGRTHGSLDASDKRISAILGGLMPSLRVLGRDLPAPAKPLRTTELGGFRYLSKLEKRIVEKVGRAVCDHRLVEDGDRIMVCVSGGKDSYALLDALLLLR